MNRYIFCPEEMSRKGVVMKEVLLSARKRNAVPIELVHKSDLNKVLKKLSKQAAAWVNTQGFKAQRGRSVTVPDAKGGISCVLFGMGTDDGSLDPFAPGKLASTLPEGDYIFAGAPKRADLLALGWLCEAYQFTKYKKPARKPAKLVCPKGVDAKRVQRLADGVKLARDLINIPANDLGPVALEAESRKLAKAYAAKIKVIKGNALLKSNFPMVHAVGRASDEEPRLIDMSWGKVRDPKVTLVGKGVTFDSGGLNIKPGGSMALMKKDMGGAANVLGLAQMIMDAGLRVRLRVLVPAVENSISAGAFRPGDVLSSRKGLSVEIGNTDAEGRLVLGDALTLADEEKPELLIDMATLTGAARVALGPDLPPFYTDDNKLAQDIVNAAAHENDPLWRMPFWQPYDTWLSSKVAVVNHITSGGFAGSMTAALFLKRFVDDAKSYVHFDIYGWTPTAKPGRPQGGAAQGILALYKVLEDRYA
ncbi:MAG: leucyl aminopeptidase family protein [Hyphomicrobiales bacterium]